MAEREHRRMSVGEFLDWQRDQDRNYELVHGVPVLPVKSMIGASDRHDRITVNAIGTLFAALRGTPCRPSTQDKSIRISHDTVRRPDVLVECGSPAPSSMEADEPRVVVEVLSPSTTRYDRFQKLEEYKTVSAIRVILLVDSELPRVTVWRRQGDAWQRHEESGLDTLIELSEIGTRLALADLYDGLSFDSGEAP